MMTPPRAAPALSLPTSTPARRPLPMNKFKRAAKTVALSQKVVGTWEKDTAMSVLRKTTKMVASTQALAATLAERAAEYQEDIDTKDLYRRDVLSPRYFLAAYAICFLYILGSLYTVFTLASGFDEWLASLFLICAFLSMGTFVILLEPLRVVIVIFVQDAIERTQKRALMYRRKRAATTKLTGDPRAQLTVTLEEVLAALGAQDLTELGGIEKLLQLMESDDAPTQFYAAAAMELVLRGRIERKEQLKELNCLTLLMRLAETTEDRVRVRVLHVLTEYLTDFEDAGTDFAQAHGLQFLQAQLQRVLEAKAQIATLSLLIAFVQGKLNRQAAAGEAGLVEICTDLMDSPQIAVAEVAVRAIKSLTAANTHNSARGDDYGLPQKLRRKRATWQAEFESADDDNRYIWEGALLVLDDTQAELTKPVGSTYVPAFL
eukprot:CAMPEP_0117008976 /NCGR_PEP_ID=MMETSP0472-20121206/8290_1 /TAXON_ID=693140 ORGANISM="Tiarina fusus, Strain LIS" /NCGR_SAMPLE_ID=MMETSP0472 /ASSEMBLY_ACC=CAM_ASM_000603 /LENGTH=432 /DNA_ID=CAMNT_0004711151 /DNA_START=1 /DNA_END=1299 /DNA_ORIENTATION=+